MTDIVNDDAVRCIECYGEAKLVGGLKIYPHRPDLSHLRFWLCDCGAYCGCHGTSPIPLGNPAGPETRAARQMAHRHFDRLWRGKQSVMSRRQAYQWLGDALQLPEGKVHIGMMTTTLASKTAELSKIKLESEKNGST